MQGCLLGWMERLRLPLHHRLALLGRKMSVQMVVVGWRAGRMKQPIAPKSAKIAAV
jgi:hypothetical protein